MYTPDIFLDNPVSKDRIITYLKVHGFRFQDLFYDIRIVCPDNYSTYHYCSRSKTLLHVYDEKGNQIYNRKPIKVTGFVECLCHYVLPRHRSGLVYHVCKIPYLLVQDHEKREARLKLERKYKD